MPEESQSLSEALSNEGTEMVAETTPAASSEEIVPAIDQSATDSSLSTSESVEVKPDETQPKPEGEAAQAVEPKAVEQLREWGNGLERDLKTAQASLAKYGGEANLNILAPVLQKANELPQNPEVWANEMWDAVGQSFVPDQVKALKSEAAWSYLQDPVSQRMIVETVFPGVTPELIQEFAAAYQIDPSIMDILRPEETPQQRTTRLTQETREKEREAQYQTVQEQNERRDAEFEQLQAQQVMGSVFVTGLSPRAEVKKQFGLEYQKSDRDTPEIAAFKERQSSRYDRMVREALMSDRELNQLANSAERWAKEKNPAHRQRASDQFAPEMARRTRALCAQIAKDLAADLKLFSPELSDQIKANNLKDLPAHVLGSSPSGVQSSGYDLSGMPDAEKEPRKFQAWAEGLARQEQARQRTPALMQSG